MMALDKIRQTETETMRRVTAAQETAVHTLDDAHRQADALVAQAIQDGHAAAARQQETAVARAQQEAAALIADAHTHADRICRAYQTDAEETVDKAVQRIIAVNHQNRET